MTMKRRATQKTRGTVSNGHWSNDWVWHIEKEIRHATEKPIQSTKSKDFLKTIRSERMAHVDRLRLVAGFVRLSEKK